MGDSGEQRASARQTIGWFCTYTPEEIIVAAGLNGRRILGRTGGTAKADAYLHPNVCAYVRACLNSALEEDIGELAGIIGVDSCDAMRRLFDVWRTRFPHGFSHILALPHRSTDEAAAFYAAELKALVGALNRHFSLNISDDDLRRGIRAVNQVRSLLQELDRLRRTSHSMSGKRFYEILQEAMTQPNEECNARLKSPLSEADASGKDREDAINVAVAGGVVDDPWVVGAIEEAGGRVGADDLCCGSRYFEGLTSEDTEPILAIAKRYIFRAPCARMSDTEARVARLMRLIEESGARGLIYYSVKFCDPHLLDWVTIGRELHARGMPALRCETDYSVSGRERTRVRIEAFLEMLQ